MERVPREAFVSALRVKDMQDLGRDRVCSNRWRKPCRTSGGDIWAKVKGEGLPLR